MLIKINDLPDDTLGFEAKGKVTGGDYEDEMVPAVEAALEGRDQIRFLYVLGEEFEGFSADAAWEDTKLGLHHRKSFERIALVSDNRLYRDGVAMFGKAMSADVKVFATSELAEARTWIALT
ncbi:MAG: STAS/SEC14 domain-containing protein [Solirubrobacterales bacterium]